MENVILEPRSVATIEFIIGLNVTIVDETKFNITFTGHATQVPGITVTFKVKIGWGSTILIPYHNSSQTQNLDSESSKSIDFNILTSEISSSYGNSYVKNNTEHTFEIQSESSSFAIMNTPSFTLSAFEFPVPSIPTNLSATFVSTNTYRFSWTASSGTKSGINLSIIRYKLYRNSSPISTSPTILENVTSHTITYSPLNMAQPWTIRAYNVYNEYSNHSSVLNITNPTFTVQNGTYKSGSTRQFQFSYDIRNFNTRYTISGGSLNTISNSTNTSGLIITSELNNSSPQTSFDIRMEDSLGFILLITKDISSVISIPTVSTSNNSITNVTVSSITINIYEYSGLTLYFSNSSSTLNSIISFTPGSTTFHYNLTNHLDYGNTYYLWGSKTNQGFYRNVYLNASFTRPHLPPDAPDINESSTNTTSINVHFAANSDGTYTMSTFQIKYKLSGGTSSYASAYSSASVPSSPFNITGLAHFRAYDIQITKSYPGISAVSDSVSNISTNLGTLPSYLSNVTYSYRNIVSGESHEIQFSWTNEGSHGNPVETLQEIRLYYREGDFNEYINDHPPTIENLETNGNLLMTTVTNGVFVGSFAENSKYNFRLVKIYTVYGMVVASDNYGPNFITVYPTAAHITVYKCVNTTATHETYEISYTHSDGANFAYLEIWGVSQVLSNIDIESTLIDNGDTLIKVFNTNTYYTSNLVTNATIVVKYSAPPFFLIRVYNTMGNYISAKTQWRTQRLYNAYLSYNHYNSPILLLQVIYGKINERKEKFIFDDDDTRYIFTHSGLYADETYDPSAVVNKLSTIILDLDYNGITIPPIPTIVKSDRYDLTPNTYHNITDNIPINNYPIDLPAVDLILKSDNTLRILIIGNTYSPQSDLLYKLKLLVFYRLADNTWFPYFDWMILEINDSSNSNSTFYVDTNVNIQDHVGRFRGYETVRRFGVRVYPKINNFNIPYTQFYYRDHTSETIKPDTSL